MQGKNAFFVSKNVLYLPFSLVRKEKKINFKKSINDIVNNRSDLRKFLLAASDYGKNIEENIKAVVADRKFNWAVVRRALDRKNKEVFE